jgi:DNA-directed RNA polymerase specialized sigma24 family protein
MNQTNDSRSLYEACRQDGSDAQIDAFTQLWAQLYRISYGMLHGRPEPEALAADCAQTALLKIHRNLDQCRDPATIRGWAAQIARRAVLDTLRQPPQARHVALADADHALAVAPPAAPVDLRAELLRAIGQGPLSDRSRRVIVGRFFAEQSDEYLAGDESQRSGEQLLPSHIQVTRSKNLAKLRQDAALLERLRDLIDA